MTPMWRILAVAFLLLGTASLVPAGSEDDAAKAQWDAGLRAVHEDRWGDAVKSLKASYELVPKGLTAYLLGYAFAKSGAPELARKYAQIALVSPDLPEQYRAEARSILAWVSSLRGISSDPQADTNIPPLPGHLLIPAIPEPAPRDDAPRKEVTRDFNRDIVLRQGPEGALILNVSWDFEYCVDVELARFEHGVAVERRSRSIILLPRHEQRIPLDRRLDVRLNSMKECHG